MALFENPLIVTHFGCVKFWDVCEANIYVHVFFEQYLRHYEKYQQR